MEGVRSFTTLWNYTILKLALRSAYIIARFTTLWNYTILKPAWSFNNGDEVLLPYEITLFSNRLLFDYFIIKVLLPYEITLFSNLK